MGQLITYNALLVFFTDPLQNIIILQVKMQVAQVANRHLNEIFAITSEQLGTTVERDISNQVFNNDISIDNITFSYNMKAPTLKNITGTIRSKVKLTPSWC